MIVTNDRRMQILEALIGRKSDTMAHLAEEFGVSRMTIFRDIQVLSCSYPIITRVGGSGGVSLTDGYRLGMKYMTGSQTALLKRLSETLTGEDLLTMHSIIRTFSWPVPAK